MKNMGLSDLIAIAQNNNCGLNACDGYFLLFNDLNKIKYYPSTNTAIIDKGYCGHVRHKMTAVKLDKLLKGTT